MVLLAKNSDLDPNKVKPVSRILLSDFMEDLLTKHLARHCDSEGNLYIPKRDSKVKSHYNVRRNCIIGELVRVQDRTAASNHSNSGWGKTVVKGTFVPNGSFEKTFIADSDKVRFCTISTPPEL
jgi:hypothetical protein